MTNTIELSHINLTSGNAPWLSIPASSEAAQTIHLSAANGFTAASYHSFLKYFNGSHSFTGMDCRGAWKNILPPPNDFNMHDFANDLIEGIEKKHSKPIIGLGHSQGGFVTLLAAIKRPDLFSKIVLIEPASLPNRWIGLLYPNIPKRLLYRFLPFIKGSLNRQRIWKSQEHFHARYRQHNTYKRFTDDAFNDYLAHGLTHNEQQWELVFSPAWEAHIFSTVEFIWKYLAKVTVPTLFVKAEYSNLYSQKQFIKQNKTLPSNISTVEITNTFHLLPHENPKQCHEVITKWL